MIMMIMVMMFVFSKLTTVNTTAVASGKISFGCPSMTVALLAQKI